MSTSENNNAVTRRASPHYLGSLTCSVLLVMLVSVVCEAQGRRRHAARSNASSAAESLLSGVFRFDPMASDKLYSIVSDAATNVPFGRQQHFLDDLTIRLSSPDQLAIELRGRRVTIASSRAARVTIEADGRTRAERGAAGALRVRAALEGERLVISTDGDGVDPFYVSFDPLDAGRRLRVTRRIHSEQLNQPLVVRSIYNKVSDVARWSIFEESHGERARPAESEVAADTSPGSVVERAERDQASLLRGELDAWIAATNSGDIRRQMDFYLPRLDAFYLARGASRESVRLEKERVFARASMIAIRAAEPEIIFRDAGRTAVMRFRKRYEIENASGRRGGEVVQELRWRHTPQGWKIASERDVRVIR